MANPGCDFGKKHSVLTARLDPHLWGRCRPDLWQTGRVSSRKIQEPLASAIYKQNITALSLSKAYQIFSGDILLLIGKRSAATASVIFFEIQEFNSCQRLHNINMQITKWTLITLFCRSLSKNATDWPWRFPEGEVRGVLMSAWASTQIRHRSGHCWAWPSTEPIARLWEWKHHRCYHKHSLSLLILAFIEQVQHSLRLHQFLLFIRLVLIGKFGIQLDGNTNNFPRLKETPWPFRKEVRKLASA